MAGVDDLITHLHILGSAADESAVSIPIANQIVTAVGESRGVPGIGAIPDESAIDVEIGSAAGVGAGERHCA